MPINILEACDGYGSFLWFRIEVAAGIFLMKKDLRNEKNV